LEFVVARKISERSLRVASTPSATFDETVLEITQDDMLDIMSTFPLTRELTELQS
jgi:hypothetical protein